jgi:hypothetical protein
MEVLVANKKIYWQSTAIETPPLTRNKHMSELNSELKLDWLATQIVEVLGETVGEKYANEKSRELQGRDRMQVLRWCNHLDSRNLNSVAIRLGIPTDKFACAVEVTRSL